MLRFSSFTHLSYCVGMTLPHIESPCIFPVFSVVKCWQDFGAVISMAGQLSFICKFLSKSSPVKGQPLRDGSGVVVLLIESE